MLLHKRRKELGSFSLRATWLFIPCLGHPERVRWCHFLGMKERDLSIVGMLSRPIEVRAIQTGLVSILQQAGTPSSPPVTNCAWVRGLRFCPSPFALHLQRRPWCTAVRFTREGLDLSEDLSCGHMKSMVLGNLINSPSLGIPIWTVPIMGWGGMDMYFWSHEFLSHLEEFGTGKVPYP